MRRQVQSPRTILAPSSWPSAGSGPGPPSFLRNDKRRGFHPWCLIRTLSLQPSQHYITLRGKIRTMQRTRRIPFNTWTKCSGFAMLTVHVSHLTCSMLQQLPCSSWDRLPLCMNRWPLWPFRRWVGPGPVGTTQWAHCTSQRIHRRGQGCWRVQSTPEEQHSVDDVKNLTCQKFIVKLQKTTTMKWNRPNQHSQK